MLAQTTHDLSGFPFESSVCFRASLFHCCFLPQRSLRRRKLCIYDARWSKSWAQIAHSREIVLLPSIPFLGPIRATMLSPVNSCCELDYLDRWVCVVGGPFFDYLANLCIVGRQAALVWFVDVVIVHREYEWHLKYLRLPWWAEIFQPFFRSFFWIIINELEIFLRDTFSPISKKAAKVWLIFLWFSCMLYQLLSLWGWWWRLTTNLWGAFMCDS